MNTSRARRLFPEEDLTTTESSPSDSPRYENKDLISIQHAAPCRPSTKNQLVHIRNIRGTQVQGTGAVSCPVERSYLAGHALMIIAAYFFMTVDYGEFRFPLSSELQRLRTHTESGRSPEPTDALSWPQMHISAVSLQLDYRGCEWVTELTVEVGGKSYYNYNTSIDSFARYIFIYLTPTLSPSANWFSRGVIRPSSGIRNPGRRAAAMFSP